MRRLAGSILVLAAIVAFALFATRTPAPVESIGDAEAVATRGPSDAVELARASEPAPEIATTQTAAAVDESPREIIVPRSTSIEGNVYHADGRAAAGAQVGLFAPASVLDSDESVYALRGSAPTDHTDRARLVRMWARSDDNGRFRFEDPEPATWVVRAELGPLVAAAIAPFVLTPGTSRTDLRLDLPPVGTLSGHVILPEGRTMTNLCLELRARGKPAVAPWCPEPFREHTFERVVPAEDGSYAFGPYAAGTHVVGLVVDPTLESRGKIDPFRGTVVPIVELELPAGPTKRDIDLRGGFPAVIVVDVRVETYDAVKLERRVGDAGSDGIVFEVERLDGPEAGASRRFAPPRDGPTECGPLLPGAWRVTAHTSSSPGWTWTLESSAWLAPAERFEIVRTVRVARGRVQVLDAKTGEPRPDAYVRFFADLSAPVSSMMLCVADEEGWIDLTLPPGDYGLSASVRRPANEPAVAPTRIEWTASGPASPAVRLTF